MTKKFNVNTTETDVTQRIPYNTPTCTVSNFAVDQSLMDSFMKAGHVDQYLEDDAGQE